jgi:cysteine desulfurase
MGKAAEIAFGRIEEDSVRMRAAARSLGNLVARVLSGQPGQWRSAQDRLPNTSNISFRYLEGESILVLLDQQGICASTGSACTAGSAEPSHVLRAMKVPADWLQGAVRFSLSRFNTEEVRM